MKLLMCLRPAAFAGLCLWLALSPLHAISPGEMLQDPALESRARGISAGLRCVVCQNQSIDDSDAPLAKDLRVLVRERLQQGDTDSQVVDYIVARYGEFVLLRPRLGSHTIVLWLTPLAVLLLASLFIFSRISRRTVGQTTQAPLDAAEKARLDRLLDKP